MYFFVIASLSIATHPDSIVYYSNGKIKEHFIFHDSDVNCRKYDSLGFLTFKGRYRYFESDTVQIEIGNTGRFKSVSLPKKLLLDGLAFEYYDSLKLKTNSYYVGGMKKGMAAEWYANGEVKSVGMYEPSGFPYYIQVGEWKYFYENGMIKSINRFKDTTGFHFESIPCGFKEEYYPNGVLKSYTYYNPMGIQDSIFISCLPDGEINSFGLYNTMKRSDSVSDAYYFVPVKKGYWLESAKRTVVEYRGDSNEVIDGLKAKLISRRLIRRAKRIIAQIPPRKYSQHY